MSYDVDPNSISPTREFSPAHPRDLETIVTILELAAIYLTDTPEATVSREEIVAEALRIGGEEVPLDETDVRIVLNASRFLVREGSRLRLK